MRKAARLALRRLLLPLAAAYGLFVTAACAFQEAIVWPLAGQELAPQTAPPGARVVQHDIADGRVPAWFFPAQGLSGEPGPTLIYFHGNGERIGNNVSLAEAYAARGISVLLPEYRGYSGLGGKPTVDGLRVDMMFFRNWLAKQPEVDPRRIVYHGTSIGGAVAAELAQVEPPAGLVLGSTFTSMRAMAKARGLPEWLVEYDFKTDAVVEKAEFPVLVLHGNLDGTIPVSHGRELAKLGDHVRYVETEGGHAAALSREVFFEEIVPFVLEVTRNVE